MCGGTSILASHMAGCSVFFVGEQMFDLTAYKWPVVLFFSHIACHVAMWFLVGTASRQELMPYERKSIYNM